MEMDKNSKESLHLANADRRFLPRLLLSVVVGVLTLVASPVHALGVYMDSNIGLTVTGITGGQGGKIPVGNAPFDGGPVLQTVSTNLPEDSFYVSNDGGGYYTSDGLAGCGTNPCSIYQNWKWDAWASVYPYPINFGGGSTEGSYIQGQTKVVSVLELQNNDTLDWSVTFSFSGSGSAGAYGATSANANSLITMDTLTNGTLSLASLVMGTSVGPFSGVFTLNLPANTLERLTFTLDNHAYAENIPPVPLPVAVWLFGSGLLGLIGIAKRKAA